MSITPIQKRFLLFLGLCIPTRLAIAALAKHISLKYLPIMGAIFLVMGLGFLYLNLFNKRKVGIETGGDVIWWNDLRPVHGFLAILFAVLAISKVRDAWVILVIDAIIGLVAFLTYHTITKNIYKLF